ncbi:sel1 repeat family protein [Luteimonas sp. SJ-92]|uniref:Sel1 repeat family protein n=1 Tax=Luteimonas salinisoli TaxID=2752307 RepID=A0A853J7Z8_9GAMM|nr:SEL1-like repeat protein [Luteimonas salinisoli]NZA25286.1 sel1 repeat family protein [Luteimonas salinisoli]
MKGAATNSDSYQHAIAMLQNGSVDIAIKKLESLSKCGDGHADGVLGALYEFGVASVQPDIPAALSLYERSIRKSDSLESWMGIGRITMHGPPEVRDYARAFECFSLAADSCNYAPAWVALGEIHLRGLGREKNLDAAEQCFRNAVNTGNTLGYPGLARVAFERRRIIESLKYRMVGALKAIREPEDSDALKQW